MKTSELTGAALDWAVAKCDFEGAPPINIVCGVLYTLEGDGWQPSTNWEQGGPIIEKWMIDVVGYRSGWRAARHCGLAPTYGYGPTPLIAAMRCYVASKLGDEVEIPKELI